MIELDQRKRQLLVFMVIGAVGFAVEAAVLTLTTVVFELNVYLARVPGFLLAVTFTWLANRKLTFSQRQQKNKRVQGIQYLVTQVGGALINWLVYMSILFFYPSLQTIPILPLAIGAIFGLVFNFILSNKIVFADVNKQTEGPL